MYILAQIISNESRMSGNSFFPAPHNDDIGKHVVVTRKCIGWNGCLGYFDEDTKRITHAFYSDELETVQK